MILDTDGNPILSFSTAIDSSAVQTYSLKIDCETDYELAADTVADITVEAKRVTDLSWTNIETTPVDLSTWAGTQQDFQIRLTAGTVSSDTYHLFSVYVRYTG